MTGDCDILAVALVPPPSILGTYTPHAAVGARERALPEYREDVKFHAARNGAGVRAASDSSTSRQRPDQRWTEPATLESHELGAHDVDWPEGSPAA